MKKTFALIAALAMSALPVLASANENVDVKQFTIDEATVETIEMEPVINENYHRTFAVSQDNSVKRQTPGGELEAIGQGVAIADQVVNLVDKVLTIIAKNQPVVDINSQYANAVPYGLSHWTQLQGWKAPVTKRYHIAYRNFYGIKVVDIVYQVHYTYGGNLNGKGKYLTGVTVEPIKVDTAWGYNVNMVAEVPDSTIANVGSHQNPVAAMQVQLKCNVHTIVKDHQMKDIFYIRGDGSFKRLTSKVRSGVPSAQIRATPSAAAKKAIKGKINSAKF